jgi:DNA-binding MarR family transcriptional regulator
MINPTKEQMVVLGAAAVNGEYAVSRAYNSKWGDDLQVLKDLESMGLMELVTLERNPQTNAFVRTARITDAGREAFIRTTKD